MSEVDPELEGIKVRAGALRQLGITDPHVVDYEYRMWMVGRLAQVGRRLDASYGLTPGSEVMREHAATVSLCAGMMLGMASMLAEQGKRRMKEESEASAAVEKETRAGKGGDNTVEIEGRLELQSASGAAVMLRRNGDGKACWLPKSQISGMTLPGKADDYPVVDVKIAIPRWLAEKKGLV